jgi:hypothetical protein
MKTQTHPNRMVRGAWLIALLLGGISIIPALRAQPAARKVDNRFLLVFDTSADMKRRLPAVQTVLRGVLAARTNSQLQTNDSLGVWAFDQELRTGQFPLQRWRPDHAAAIASNIAAFVVGQRYAKKTGFDTLMPALTRIVESSERLTVVIFCDGNGEIQGTPYDSGINQIFQQHQGERQKARQPVVLVLRSQRGKYVDCVVSFPPQPVGFPAFPPLPEDVPAPVQLAPAPPRPAAPPLIIIGTPPTNRVPPVPSQPPPTNPPPVTVASTPAPMVVVPLTPTNSVSAQLAIVPAVPSPTNAVAPPVESPGISRIGAFFMGMAFLAVAGGLAFSLFRFLRKDGGGSA